MRLAEFQSLFATGLRHGAMPDELRAEAGVFAERLSIHANHVRISLREALALHFPVTLRLVGEGAFVSLASRFLAATPPEDVRLALYGARFPGFLGAEPALVGHPAIAEVAGFEWARHLASIAPACPPVDPATLDGAARLRLSPGASVIAAAHAVDHIWEINQPGRDGTPDRPVAIPTRLLLWRDKDGFIRAASLPPADVAFLSRIVAGADLDTALAAALEAGGDLATVLARALGRGVLCLADTEFEGEFR
ncbi:MAG: DNA-binding domain-containing protein [Zavarzinia sp.]|nr:DNA-binding domain-containing protein [Zavarzinia sp.]